MIKKYYSLYGLLAGEIDSTADLVSTLLDIDFVRRHSSYSGDYCSYKGALADEISVRSNYNSVDTEWREEAFKEYKNLIYVTHNSGKNAEKLIKSAHIKNAFSRNETITLLRARIIEE